MNSLMKSNKDQKLKIKYLSCLYNMEIIHQLELIGFKDQVLYSIKLLRYDLLLLF